MGIGNILLIKPSRYFTETLYKHNRYAEDFGFVADVIMFVMVKKQVFGIVYLKVLMNKTELPIYDGVNGLLGFGL